MNTSFNQDPSTVDSPTETVKQLQHQIQLLKRSLDASFARNRQLMAAMPQIAWIAQADGSINEFNYPWYEYTGLTGAESLYWGFLQAVHPQDRDRLLTTVKQASIERQSYEIECRLLGADGTGQWFRGQATPVLGADGEVLEWVGTYSKTTDPARLPQEKLQKQPEFISTLLENLSDGIVACDADGVLTLFNRAAQEFHALPQETISASQWAEHYDLYHPDGTLMQTDEIPLFRALKGEIVRNAEMRIIPKKGSVRTLLASGNAIANSAGEKLGAVVVMRDITDRVQAEQALRQSERRLSVQIQQTPLAVIEWNINFEVTDWNNSAEAIFGYTKQEALGRHASELIIPENLRGNINKIWQKLITNKGCNRSTNENLTKDGKTIICEWYNTPLVDNEGNLIGVTSLAQDITVRVQAEEALRENQQRLTQILETAPNGITIVNRDGKISSANAAAEKILGLRRSQITERIYNDAAWKITTVDGQPFPEDELPFTQVMRTSQPVYGIEQAIEREDGNRVILSINAAPLRNSSAEVLGMVASISDITDRKRLEAERDRFFTLSSELMCIAGLDGYFKRLNPAFEKTLGYTSEELLSIPFMELIHPEDQNSSLAEVEKLSKGELTVYFENRYRCKDGSYRWLAWTSFPVLEEGLLYAIARDITTSKQMEETLHRREQEFKALLDNAPDVIVRCDRNLRYVYVNAEVERATGLPALAFIGKTFAELGSPKELCEVWETTLRQVFETGKEQAIEFQSLSVDGLRIYQSRVVPEFDKEGFTQYALVVSRDITELKQAEAEIRTLNAELEQRVRERTAQLATANQLKDELLLREQAARSQAEAAEGRYRDLVNGLVDAIVWECDATTLQFSFVSQSAEILLGYPVEEWLSQPKFWGNLIHPDDLDWVMAFCSEETAAGQDHEFEYRCIAANGEVIWLRDRAYIVRDKSGKIEKLRGLMINITPRKQAETEREKALVALRESEAKFRRVAESNMIGIVFWDIEGNFTDANDAFLDMVGYTREDLLLGKLRWPDMTPPEYRPLDDRAIEEMMQSGVCPPWEKEYIRKDGSRVSILLGTAFLEGTKQDGVAFALDLSDRKRAEEALRARADELAHMATVLAQTNAVLEKRNQELDQFAYVTSHDLKAPLRAIANLSHWIEEDIEDLLTDETRHQMNLLRGRVNRMETLINALLAYSRAGRIKIKPEQVNVERLLAEVIDSLAPPPEFKVEVEPGMPTLVTELLPLQQIFTNLIGNAIKHHHRPDGQVKISCQNQEDAYEFAITDDGLGIAPEYHEKIFMIFQTLQARDKVENTGVGLALVKRMLESKGGAIALDSAEGQGSTFRFTWPKNNFSS
ncbi:MAG TPA: PAS domain S-box protein [Candidatus Obscuribacterales bacterium]